MNQQLSVEHSLPEEKEGMHVEVQPKLRMSTTLGRDRESRAAADEKSLTSQSAAVVERTDSARSSSSAHQRVPPEQVDKVEEEKAPENQHQYHSHEEGDVCACKHFTANYTRIRSQFSKFEGLPPICLCVCFSVLFSIVVDYLSGLSLCAYLHPLLLLFIIAAALSSRSFNLFSF